MLTQLGGICLIILKNTGNDHGGTSRVDTSKLACSNVVGIRVQKRIKTQDSENFHGLKQ